MTPRGEFWFVCPCIVIPFMQLIIICLPGLSHEAFYDMNAIWCLCLLFQPFIKLRVASLLCDEQTVTKMRNRLNIKYL